MAWETITPRISSRLPAFPVAAAPTSAGPGPAMAPIQRRTALRGTRAAGPTVLGLEAGLFSSR